MYELLPPVGSIHGRRLIELGVDACNCGQIDDGIPAEGLPDHGHYHGRHEKLSSVKKIRSAESRGS